MIFTHREKNLLKEIFESNFERKSQCFWAVLGDILVRLPISVVISGECLQIYLFVLP